MTRNQYLNQLRFALSFLSDNEREEWIEEVENHFDNGLAGGKKGRRNL